jgi:hypothetical protein
VLGGGFGGQAQALGQRMLAIRVDGQHLQVAAFAGAGAGEVGA